MIKNIILDIGNVLLEFNPKEYFSDVLKDSKVADEIVTTMLEGEAWKQYDLGNYTLEDVKSSLKKDLSHVQEEIDFVLSKWTDLLKPIPFMFDKMQEWKTQGYKIYLLSNLNKEADEFITTHFDLYAQADGMVLSHKVHLSKPDTRIFAHLCDKYKLYPPECLFIDDNLENVLSAITFGIASIHFKDVEQVKHDLEHIFEAE